jgi:hypothetical protein
VNDKIREMIIEEATAAMRELLPQLIREIAQKHVKAHVREQEALRFDKGNDYY